MPPITVRPRIQQLLTAVVVLGFVFQLGACPCGCLEHNYWMQLVGLSSPEPQGASDRGHQPTAEQEHEHDCMGVGGPIYVNNVRPIVSPQPDMTGRIDWVSDGSEIHLCRYGELSQRSPPDLADLGHTPPGLQVFLL